VKVLVSGVAGFVGSQLAETLATADDDEVVGVDAITDYYDVATKRANAASVTAAGVRFVEADLRYSDLRPLLDGVEVVYHQAAQPGVRASWDERFADYATHNVLGTQRLLEAARHAGVRRFVYASSSSIYGNAVTYPTLEETVPAPFSPYGVTKLAAEHLCKAYAQNFGFPTVSLRYFTVYGPRQRPDMSIHRLIEAALDGTSFPRFGDGTQVREFTHVDDVIAANRLAATAEVSPGAVFNISGGSEIVLNDLIALVESAVGAPVTVDQRPAEPGDVHRNGGSTVRAREQLGWVPRVGLEDGVASQVAWHRSRR
jgi:nucleoside-diphosphate-sugar epimerase